MRHSCTACSTGNDLNGYATWRHVREFVHQSKIPTFTSNRILLELYCSWNWRTSLVSRTLSLHHRAVFTEDPSPLTFLKRRMSIIPSRPMRPRRRHASCWHTPTIICTSSMSRHCGSLLYMDHVVDQIWLPLSSLTESAAVWRYKSLGMVPVVETTPTSLILSTGFFGALIDNTPIRYSI